MTTATRDFAAGERYRSPHIVPTPVKGTRITEPYARMVAREAYFWAWPMVNIWNRRQAFSQAPERALVNGVLPIAPLNQLSMLHDYIEPGQRAVACPNQDVVYGSGILALEDGPVVLQVPDFRERFWVYQAVDVRTDSFADIGAMYGTKPGFYLIVGPQWDGKTPDDITQVFACPTSTGMVIPRIFQDDTPDDQRAIQDVLSLIDMYPVAKHDGVIKRRDWRRLPKFSSSMTDGGSGETRWVAPETFFDQLPAVLADAPPLAGEDTRYAEILAIIAAAQKDPALMKVLVDEATRAEQALIEPLLQFRNWGTPLPHHWTTEKNGAAFGSDYFMRTAIARSNILVNKPVETKYFYQDLDANGDRLNGASRYRVTFPANGLPPVRGFWSMTLYDRFHFFVPNAIRRYSIGTKNRDLSPDADGSLTLLIQADEPSDPVQRRAWLPAPRGEDFSLYLRAYWPERAVLDGTWTPPPVRKV